MKLQGIYPAAATAFDSKGELYKVKIQHNIEKWNRTDLSGYIVCGSTGENVLLSTPEKIQLFEWFGQYTSPDKNLIAGTGQESVRETVALTNRAAECGFKAALVMTPHYYRGHFQKPETQLLFFRSVADQAKIPVLVYNFPQVSGITLAPETIAALSEHPNIIGMKDSSGNLEGTKAFIAAAKQGFQVMTGSSTVLAASLAAGCTGAILAFANAAPYVCISIWEAHRTRETAAAEDWQNRIKAASELLSTKYGIPGLKHAMDLNGYFGGDPRLPFVPVGPEAQKEIAAAFDGLTN